MGINLFNGSSATGNNVIVADNTGRGISVSGKSSLNLSNAMIRGNRGTQGGINLFNGATANLHTVTISDHTDANSFVLALGTGSSLNANNLTVTNNAGGGISLFNDSSLFCV